MHVGIVSEWFVKLGLGFRENGEEEKKKREKCFKKWQNPDPWPFMYYSNRVGSKPTHYPSLVAFGCEFSGSGSIQRLWDVLKIRIRQRWVGSTFFGPLSLFFSVFLIAYYLHLYFCYLNSCACWFSYKNSQKNYHSFLICSWLFRGIFACSKLMEVICANSYLDLYILCFFVWIFLYDFWSKMCHVTLMLGV